MNLRLQGESNQKQELCLKETLNQKKSLEQYLKQEDLIKELIRFADKNETWRKFDKDGFDFIYAEVPYELSKTIAKEYGYAFSHCMYNNWGALFFGKKVNLAQGDWVKFVVEDKLTQQLIDYPAIHEQGEELSLGNHFFASKLEFAYASQKEAITSYTNFIDREFPSKFVDLEEKVHFPIIPEELIEIIKKKECSEQKKKELHLAEEMIAKHPIPKIVLKKINEYSRENYRVCNAIKNCSSELRKGIFEFMADNLNDYSLEELTKYINQTISFTMKNLNIKNLKVLSKPRINQSIEMLSNLGLQDIRKNIKVEITLEDNLVRLIQKAKIGQSVINVKINSEENIKDL